MAGDDIGRVGAIDDIPAGSCRNRIAGTGGRHDHIASSAADQRIVPGASVEIISSGAGQQRIVARSGNKDLLESGKLKIVMQLALNKHAELPGIPLVTDFVTDPGDKKVLEVIFSRQSMGRPLIAPPSLDPRLTQVLRDGFAAAMNDPELLAEGARTGLEINFVSGDDVQALVEGLYRSPPAVVARAQAIAAGK